MKKLCFAAAIAALTSLAAVVFATAQTAYNFRITSGWGVVESPADTFNIPRCSSGKLGYVVTAWPAPLVGSSMWVEYRVDRSADAVIVSYENRVDAPRIAMFFDRKYDKRTQWYYDRGYRWWSRARPLLAMGVGSHEVALQKDLWTGGGTQLQVYWDAARANVANVGFTLGDSRSAGHGVCMKTGTAKLVITGFRVKP